MPRAFRHRWNPRHHRYPRPSHVGNGPHLSRHRSHCTFDTTYLCTGAAVPASSPVPSHPSTAFSPWRYYYRCSHALPLLSQGAYHPTLHFRPARDTSTGRTGGSGSGNKNGGGSTSGSIYDGRSGGATWGNHARASGGGNSRRSVVLRGNVRCGGSSGSGGGDGGGGASAAAKTKQLGRAL